MSKRAAPPPEAAPSFEHALAELESIVARMESGEISLEDSLAAYERGVSLLRRCRETLDAAEQKIRVLDGEATRDLRMDEGEA